MRKLRVGVAGLGRAFSVMAGALQADARIELTAAADPRPDAAFPGKRFPSVEALCRSDDIDVLYVATPHQFHAEHACLAAAAGKHILVEKPMALSLEQCRAMIAAAQKAGVQLVVGHSHSFDAPVLKAKALIDSGAFGRLRMISALDYTDFLYRPRRPEELDTARGGGAVFNQAAHQVDVARLLAGGLAKSVRAVTGNWDASRPTEGAYSALITFEDGAFASLAYSGYAHFDSDELLGWIGEMGHAKDPGQHGAARRALRNADETALKYARRAEATLPRHHPHFGLLIASCERADLRPLPQGVMIYGDEEKRLDLLPPPQVPRVEVIDELYDAVVLGSKPVHDGAWGMATLEVCLAMLQSAREAKEISLSHQVKSGSRT